MKGHFALAFLHGELTAGRQHFSYEGQSQAFQYACTYAVCLANCLLSLRLVMPADQTLTVVAARYHWVFDTNPEAIQRYCGCCITHTACDPDCLSLGQCTCTS